jgi:hypothetical protein
MRAIRFKMRSTVEISLNKYERNMKSLEDKGSMNYNRFKITIEAENDYSIPEDGNPSVDVFINY